MTESRVTAGLQQGYNRVTTGLQQGPHFSKSTGPTHKVRAKKREREMCINTQADTALSRLRHIERQSCEEYKTGWYRVVDLQRMKTLKSHIARLPASSDLL